MDENETPFWLIAVAVVLGVASVGLGIWGWTNYRQLGGAREEAAKAQESATKAQGELDAVRARAGELEGNLSDVEQRIKALESAKDAENQARKSLERDMAEILKNKDITISELQGKLTVNILSSVMFDSGKAELKVEGQDVLKSLGAALKSLPGRQVLVVGHTDNVPIGTAKFASNWELSAARATSAVRHLVDSCAVDPRRIGAVGYGEYHPVADNSTPEGRAQNRRISVVILAEDLLKPGPTAATGPKPAAAPAVAPAQDGVPAAHAPAGRAAITPIPGSRSAPAKDTAPMPAPQAAEAPVEK
ncbi:MAG: hypothetical protein A3K19_10095 [Lentisphaerae bacterium RIFOXYB12_FULL_65_16]|nr:MAG: hypothetical protein A3K18_27745 [Lentisphaerae bacterium RIFOXYA12_64_32]OGV91298.1 MAG: hypothetical protein A3K19_10095 [Lentisphaerae bacterium RIFOXYB12_FULL_65_16]